MKKYDILVIGSGAGLEVASYAAQNGMSVALVEEGSLGETCLNRGCIPSKMLIHSADVAETIKNSEKFGIKSNIENIDFASIVKRVSEVVDSASSNIENSVRENGNPMLYKMRGKFVAPKRIQVGDPSAGSGQVEQIEAEKVFIVGGTRPSTPPIPGLETTPYLDSTKALRLEKQPEHLIVIGGGYIAAELAHFFGALGTKITILVRGNRMLNDEDEEIAEYEINLTTQKPDPPIILTPSENQELDIDGRGGIIIRVNPQPLAKKYSFIIAKRVCHNALGTYLHIPILNHNTANNSYAIKEYSADYFKLLKSLASGGKTDFAVIKPVAN